MYYPYYDKIVFNQSVTNKTRKPIFGNSYHYSRKTKMQNKSLLQPNDTHIKIHNVHHDLCGCQHNLEPCPIIKLLLSNINQKSMRNEYNQLQRQNKFKSKFQLRKKYLRFLPSYYPQLYHAQLSNILMNIQEDITLNQFISLAWIQYHSKYEYITYFLFVDMNKSKQPKKRFFDQLQLHLISQEAELYTIINEFKAINLNLILFIEEFHQTFGANIIPLSQYAKFIRILLKVGERSLKLLIVLLLTTKKQTLLDLLKFYSQIEAFRQRSSNLDWQQFFEKAIPSIQ